MRWPRFTQVPQPQVVAKGAFAMFNCTLDAKPYPYVTWLKNQQEALEPCPAYETLSDENGFHSLMVVDATEEDRMHVSCQATSSAQTDDNNPLQQAETPEVTLNVTPSSVPPPGQSTFLYTGFSCFRSCLIIVCLCQV